MKPSRFVKNFKKDIQLWVFMIFPLLYLFVFIYYPMFGIQIAFKDYSPSRGIWGSPWAGLKHFKTFLNSYMFSRVVVNTIILSFYQIIAGFPLPIIFALMLNVVRNRFFKKFVQTVTYIPNFISTVVLVGMMVQFFSPVAGAYGYIFKNLLNAGYPDVLMGIAGTFRHFYVWSDIWQGLGWGTIIYIAALSSVNPELHEAAEIDGATRLQRIIHIDIPAILPVAAILLILRFGTIMSIGYEKVLLMQTGLNLQTSEIISTYVYKTGLQAGGNFSYSTAIDLFNSIINCIILLTVNKISKKLSGNEVMLF